MTQVYLVTGGTGFLGQHLVRQLLKEQDAEVRVLARGGDRALSRAGAKLVRGSVLKPAQLAQAMEGVTHLFHLAGKVERDPRRAHTLFTLHVTGTRNVLEAAADAGVKRAVIASTSGTVGVTDDGRTIPNDESDHVTELVKNWPYYLSKVYAEKTAMAVARKIDTEVIMMRPTLLLGPGDSRLSSTKDVANYLDGQIPIIPSGGLSFVDVRDTASAFITAMERGEPGACYLLGAANLTFDAFFERLESISGVPRPRLAVPNRAARVGARALDAAMRMMGKTPDVDPISVEMSQHFWYIDWSAAMRDLDFSPRDPGQTLFDTVRWIKANNPQRNSPAASTPEPTTAPSFRPNKDWEGDYRHAAFTAPDSSTDAYGEPIGEDTHPSPNGTAIPYQGNSRISYDNYEGGGPGLESLLGGTLKGAVGSIVSTAATAASVASQVAQNAGVGRNPYPNGGGTSARRPQPNLKPTDVTIDSDQGFTEASALEGAPEEQRAELDTLLAEATPEEMATILRLVRRMKS